MSGNTIVHVRDVPKHDQQISMFKQVGAKNKRSLSHFSQHAKSLGSVELLRETPLTPIQQELIDTIG